MILTDVFYFYFFYQMMFMDLQNCGLRQHWRAHYYYYRFRHLPCEQIKDSYTYPIHTSTDNQLTPQNIHNKVNPSPENCLWGSSKLLSHIFYKKDYVKFSYLLLDVIWFWSYLVLSLHLQRQSQVLTPASSHLLYKTALLNQILCTTSMSRVQDANP